jgi:hypothetical protein
VFSRRKLNYPLHQNNTPSGFSCALSTDCHIYPGTPNKQDTMSQDHKKQKTIETATETQVLELSDRDLRTTSIIMMIEIKTKLENVSMELVNKK